MSPTAAQSRDTSPSVAITQWLEHNAPLTSTPTVRKHLPKPDTRRVQDSAQDLSKQGLIYYQSVQGQENTAEYEHNLIKVGIREKQQRFDEFCKKQAQEIDVKMQQRHITEQRETMDRQRAETQEAKQNLVDAKRKHREEMGLLIEEKKSKAQEVEDLGDKCDDLLKGLSREDMMRALSRANRAPKRRWNDAVGEGAKQ